MTNLKTSAACPLRVDFVAATAHGLPGRLGLTIAPGKKDLRRNWDRDLETDLTRLREVHHADLLVSLMQKPEYAMLQIPTLMTAARRHKIRVRHFPIVDVSTPLPDELPRFARLIRDIIAAMRAGKVVVVHCRGGIGRSGLVAACCLVELDRTPAAAIAAVRAARPGAVETVEQERWVATYAAYRAAKPRRRSRRKTSPGEPTVDRVVGCLLGGALGDALGYPIEFKRASTIAERFGLTAPADLAYAGGPVARFSDDTQMTLFVAEGFIRAYQRWSDRGICHVPGVVERALVRWYATQTDGEVDDDRAGWLFGERGLHSARAPGTTCMSALAAVAAGRPGGTVDKPTNDSKGCGAVMRAAPFGLADSRESAFEYARDTGVLTHGHPSGYLSGAYLASLIWDLLRGTELLIAMEHADTLLHAEPGHEEVAASMDAARAGTGSPTVSELQRLGGGWVGEEALAIAVRCVLAHDPTAPRAIETTLWTAANHSGDSDSTASIAGNLLGAMYGAAALPTGWLAQLELRPVIERLARDLHSIVEPDAKLSYRDYPPN